MEVLGYIIFFAADPNKKNGLFLIWGVLKTSVPLGFFGVFLEVGSHTHLAVV